MGPHEVADGFAGAWVDGNSSVTSFFNGESPTLRSLRIAVWKPETDTVIVYFPGGKA